MQSQGPQWRHGGLVAQPMAVPDAYEPVWQLTYINTSFNTTLWM